MAEHIDILITVQLRLCVFDLERPKFWRHLRAAMKFMAAGHAFMQGWGRFLHNPLPVPYILRGIVRCKDKFAF